MSGNIGSIEPGVIDNPGERIIDYALNEEGVDPRKALVRVMVLPGGFRLLVGRDLVEQEQFRFVIRRKGRVRRARLYYLRDRVGKRTRLREVMLKEDSGEGSSSSQPVAEEAQV